MTGRLLSSPDFLCIFLLKHHCQSGVGADIHRHRKSASCLLPYSTNVLTMSIQRSSELFSTDYRHSLCVFLIPGFSAQCLACHWLFSLLLALHNLIHWIAVSCLLLALFDLAGPSAVSLQLCVCVRSRVFWRVVINGIRRRLGLYSILMPRKRATSCGSVLMKSHKLWSANLKRLVFRWNRFFFSKMYRILICLLEEPICSNERQNT